MTATLTPTGDRAAARSGHVLTGMGTLVRFMLRRDRVRLPAWILGITLFTLASVAALPGLYPAASDRQARATLMQNPGTRAVSGPGYGLEDYHFGAMISNEYLSWIVIFVALMSIFVVVRHTRLEEETGRAELVRSSRVGRHATTTAALVVAFGANLVLGALLAVSLGSLGLESVGWAGSLLFGAGQAAVGVVFAAVAAVTVQLNGHARGASGLAGAVLAFSYTLRAAGDMAELGGNALSWLSPIGWAQQTRAYVDDRWWPLLLPLALTLVLAASAYWLSTRRDVGASLVQTRPGPAHAGDSLATPLGLAWRLHRASVVWWGVAMFLFALGYGTLASEIERFVSEMSVIQDAVAELGGTIIDAWLAIIVLVFAVFGAVFAVLAAGRARSEENSGRAEPVLATAVSRARWLGSHLVIALAGSAVIMAVTGLGLGISVAGALGDTALIGRILGATMAHVPAVWLVTGIAVALYGLASRAAPLVWIVVVYAGVVGWLGQLLQFPQWAMNLSPLGHTPLLPAEAMRWPPLVVMSALAIILIVAGLVAFRRRDVETTA